MQNQSATSITKLFLIGFSVPHRLPLFCFFIFYYIFVLCGNILIIIVVKKESKLHLPMYFFIANFSFMEIWYTTIFVPRIIRDLISNDKSIALASCIIQFYFAMVCGANEHCLLAVMSYDRFIAICHPLYYNVIMKPMTCVRLILGSWVVSLLAPAFSAYSLFQTKYCGVYIDHFFCDIAPLLQISCRGIADNGKLFYTLSTILILSCFSLICMSYIFILYTVLHIKSNHGRYNAFSTCASHLTVVMIFYSACIFTYIRPGFNQNYHADKLVSVANVLVAPVLNPMIYAFRNKAMKEALKKCVQYH